MSRKTKLLADGRRLNEEATRNRVRLRYAPYPPLYVPGLYWNERAGYPCVCVDADFVERLDAGFVSTRGA